MRFGVSTDDGTSNMSRKRKGCDNASGINGSSVPMAFPLLNQYKQEPPPSNSYIDNRKISRPVILQKPSPSHLCALVIMQLTIVLQVALLAASRAIASPHVWPRAVNSTLQATAVDTETPTPILQTSTTQLEPVSTAPVSADEPETSTSALQATGVDPDTSTSTLQATGVDSDTSTPTPQPTADEPETSTSTPQTDASPTATASGS